MFPKKKIRVPKLLDGGQLREYAYKILTVRSQSVGEMRTKLRSKAETKEDVEPLIERLKEAGVLNDDKFAEHFAQNRLENEGLGKMRVLRDLRQRKVGGPAAEKAVASTFSEVDEIALIEQFLARKFRKVNLPEYLAEPKNLRAAFRRLRYAGYSSAITIKVLKRYTSRAEEIGESIEDGE